MNDGSRKPILVETIFRDSDKIGNVDVYVYAYAQEGISGFEIRNLDAQIAAGFMSEEELMTTANGGMLYVGFEALDADNLISDAEKTYIENTVKVTKQSAKVGKYYDFSFYKMINENGMVKKLSEINNSIEISMDIPRALIDASVNRKYSILREHKLADGSTIDFIEPKYDELSNRLTFKANQFSTYAIVYDDEEVEEKFSVYGLENTKEEARDLFKDDYMEQSLASGKEVRIEFGIDSVSFSAVLDEAKNKVNVSLPSNYQVGAYYDSILYEMVDDYPIRLYKVPNGKVKVKAKIPADVYNSNRTFKIMYADKGNAVLLDSYDVIEEGYIGFETQNIGYFALIYTDSTNTHIHEYSRDWKYDEHTHWMECISEVGECDKPKVEIEEHNYDSTTNECVICHYKKEKKGKIELIGLDDYDPEEIIDLVLTDEEKQLLENGEDIKINYAVSDVNAGDISNDERILFNENLPENYRLGSFFDTTMFKVIRDNINKVTLITRGTMKVRHKIPDEIFKSTRKYKLLRYYNGSVQLLDPNVDYETGTIDFDTNILSRYALVYYDEELMPIRPGQIIISGLNYTPEQIRPLLLTPDDNTALSDGKNIEIKFTPSEIGDDRVSVNDMNLTRIYMPAYYSLGRFIEANLSKNVDGQISNITRIPGGKIKLKVTVPSSMRKDGREYKVLNIYDDKADVIDPVFSSADYSLEFEVDRIGTINIAFKDSADSDNGTTDNDKDDKKDKDDGTQDNDDSSDDDNDGDGNGGGSGNDGGSGNGNGGGSGNGSGNVMKGQNPLTADDTPFDMLLITFIWSALIMIGCAFYGREINKEGAN